MNQPWKDEPDEETWTHDGLFCMALRKDHGAWCGYVCLPIFPEKHPWYGKESSELGSVKVHGGVTWSGIIPDMQGRWFIGFDCAHGDDVIPYGTKSYPLGWINDITDPRQELQTYRTLKQVKAWTNELADQVNAAVLERERSR